eukprot:scaffold8494_cov125-Isochrysis_galbana.AAC.3
MRDTRGGGRTGAFVLSSEFIQPDVRYMSHVTHRACIGLCTRVAVCVAVARRYTGYEGERLEGPCPHQSSEQLVDEDNRGHHNPPDGPEGINWMPLVGDKGRRGVGRHRGGRLAGPVRGHLLTQLTH